jgi:LPS export ABC transporter protein LptC
LKKEETTIGLLALALAILFAGCSYERSSPVSVAQLAEEEGPDQESWNVEYYLSEEGETRAILVAARMMRFESEDSVYVMMEGSAESPVTVQVFGPTGERSDVSAQHIRFFEERRVYELTGAVSLQTSTGRTLLTENLIWFESDEKVTAEGFVQIDSETESLQGYGLEADEMLDSFTLHRVTGRKYIEEE